VTPSLRLGTFLSIGGENIGAWRHPDANFSSRADFRYYLEAANIAEQALFDLILVADVPPQADHPIELLSRHPAYDRLEPAMVSAALAVATKDIGIVPTLSTTYNEPYHVARKVASLDHLSAGRAGWNIVTGANETEAQNFSLSEHPVSADRYDRAEEFVDVVRGLWKSWERDAFLRDKERGIYFDPTKLQILNHKGRHFSVRGPLDVIPTPQVQPVLVQAGSSVEGKRLGSRVADVIFTTEPEMGKAAKFRKEMQAAALAHGRRSNGLVVLNALIPVIAETDEAARAKFDYLVSLIHPAMAVPQLSRFFSGVDLSAYDLDKPLPRDLPDDDGRRTASRRASILEMAEREGLTLRQLAQRVAGTRGHLTMIGTAKSVADKIEAWITAGSTDGFLLVPPMMPHSLREFCQQVVPELQRRGIFRTAYEGSSLRERLGFPNNP